MIDLLPCQDRIHELVQFAARLNSDGAHHIGFFGVGTKQMKPCYKARNEPHK